MKYLFLILLAMGVYGCQDGYYATACVERCSSVYIKATDAPICYETCQKMFEKLIKD